MEKKTIVVDVQTEEGVKSLNRLEASFEDVYGEVQPLTGRIGELEDQLYQMAAAGQQGTQEFTQLAAEIGKMKKVIVDVDMAVDGMSGSMSQKLGGSIQGLAGGFELVQGTMGAFGVESAKVEEALLKVQSAMAISQGVQTIRESIPAFKALGATIAQTAVGQNILTGAQKLYNLVVGKSVGAMKTLKLAIAATGIGALVLVLVEVASAMDLFGDSTEDAEEKQKKLKDQMAKTAEQMKYIAELSNQSVEANDQYTEMLIKQAKLRGASEEEVNKIIKENIEDNLKERENEVKRQHAIYQQVVDDKNSNVEALIEAEEAWGDSISKETEARRKLRNFDLDQDVKAFEDAQDKKQAAQQKYADERKSALESIRNAEKEYHLNLMGDEERELYVSKEKYKALLDNANKYGIDNEELINAQKNEENDIKLKYNQLEIANEKEKQAELDRIQQEKNDERIANEDAQFKLSQELTNTAQEQELAQLVEAYDAKYLIAADNAELELLLAEQFKIDQAAIDEKYRKEKEEKEKESAEKAKALKKEQIDAELNMAKTALSTLGEIADLFAGKDEASQKKAFNVKKAAAIATTTIETYQAAQSAYASQMTIPTPDAPIRAAISAGIAIAQGLVRVASISKTKFQGGGGGASGGGGGGGGSVPSPSTPANFNIVGNSNTNQLMEGLNNNPVQAFVVSGAVTTAQSLDRNQIKTATL
jgi:myosin heavy subunit